MTPANGLVAASDNFIQGGWLKKTATFDVHTRAMTAGKCTLRFNSGWPPSCTAEGEQLRTVNKVKVTVAPPGLIPTTFSRFSLNEQGGTVFRQLLDTSVPGTTSGPLHRTANYVGRYVYDFQSVVNMTSCDIAPPNSEIKTRHLNVAECRTRFGYFNGKVIHLPAQSVSVYLPPSLAGDWAQPLQDAVDSWNDRLAGTAYPHLTVVNVDCGSGGDCVEIKEGPPTGQTCAATQPGTPDSTGTIQERSWVKLPAGRTGANAQRSFAHEFGHLLGLYEFEAACSLAQGIMAPRTIDSGGCEQLPEDAALGPTESDGAAARSVYDTHAADDHPRRVCGF